MPWNLEKEWAESDLKKHLDYAGGPYPYPQTMDVKGHLHAHMQHHSWARVHFNVLLNFEFSDYTPNNIDTRFTVECRLLPDAREHEIWRHKSQHLSHL